MRTVFAYDKLHEVASKAMDRGAAMRSVATMFWDIAGKCEAPVYRALTFRPRPEGMEVWQQTTRSSSDRREIELETRCRRCGACLRMRSALWRFRCQNEVMVAPRTWFVTLTLSPQAHFQMLCRASARLSARGSGDFETLSADRQFAERHSEIGKELTLWMKRVRKASGVPLRYCLVAEAHKSGLPHYHALIHEVDGDRPVRSRIIRQKWTLGFSTAKLVAQGDEAKSSAYVAKYLSKSAIARVRASQGYGHYLPLSSVLTTERETNVKQRPTMKHERKRERSIHSSVLARLLSDVSIGTVQ